MSNAKTTITVTFCNYLIHKFKSQHRKRPIKLSAWVWVSYGRRQWAWLSNCLTLQSFRLAGPSCPLLQNIYSFFHFKGTVSRDRRRVKVVLLEVLKISIDTPFRPLHSRTVVPLITTLHEHKIHRCFNHAETVFVDSVSRFLGHCLCAQK